MPSTNTPPFKAVIIGAGRIAAGYDQPGDEAVLTHAHALAKQPRITCVGIYDIDYAKAEEAATKWSLNAVREFSDLMALAPDLAIVAVPDAFHEDMLVKLLEQSPKIVLCEKPLTTNFAASKNVIEAYREKGVALMLNYQRRFTPLVRALKKRIDNGETGRPLSATLHYSKGILHNGSHGVDLFRYLYGEARSVLITSHIVDFEKADPTVTGSVRFDDVDVAFVAADERCFSLFEVDLLFEKERIRFSHSGLRYERLTVQPDPVYPGYFELFTDEAGDTGLSGALGSVIQAATDYMDGATEITGLADDSLGTQLVCELMANAPFDARRTVPDIANYGRENK